MASAAQLHRPRARALVAMAAAAALTAATRADDTNFRPYLVGTRAAGMGGAFTALADDGSGPFYNPAGIASSAARSCRSRGRSTASRADR